MTQEELQDKDLDIYNTLHKLDPNDGHAYIYLRACYKEGLTESIVTYAGEDSSLIDMVSEYMEQDEGITQVLYMGVLNWAYESKDRLIALQQTAEKLLEDYDKEHNV